MYWHENLYLGKSVSFSWRSYKKKIEKRKIHPHVWLIAYRTDSDALLEIVPSPFLLQKSYPDEPMHVVGMAGTRREAMKILEEIIGDVYASDGSLSVKEFFTGGGRKREGDAVC